MATDEVDYGKIELSRAHEYEKQVLDRRRASDEAAYFKRHPLARTKLFLGFKIEAPSVEHSLTIYEARRNGQSLFLARASGEFVGGVWEKKHYMEFERLVTTRREVT